MSKIDNTVIFACLVADDSIIDHRIIFARNIAHHLNGKHELVRHYIHHGKRAT